MIEDWLYLSGYEVDDEMIDYYGYRKYYRIWKERLLLIKEEIKCI